MDIPLGFFSKAILHFYGSGSFFGAEDEMYFLPMLTFHRLPFILSKDRGMDAGKKISDDSFAVKSPYLARMSAFFYSIHRIFRV